MIPETAFRWFFNRPTWVPSDIEIYGTDDAEIAGWAVMGVLERQHLSEVLGAIACDLLRH